MNHEDLIGQLLLFLEEDQVCCLIGFAFPFDTRVIEKEGLKFENYRDLKNKFKKIWNYQKV